MKNAQHTTHTTNSITEINALSQSPKDIHIKAGDLADAVTALKFISGEIEHLIELVKVLADGKISAQLEPKQKFALALSVINKGEYLADLAFGDAQSLNEHLKGTSHHQNFYQTLSREIIEKQAISLVQSNKGQS